MNIFDMDCELSEANVVVNSVPWDVTTSYGGGASLGAYEILRASSQIDFFSSDLPKNYQHKYFMNEIPHFILEKSKQMRKLSDPIFEGTASKSETLKILEQVNNESDQINQWIYEQTKATLNLGKIPATLGGDHSIPYGAIQAVAEKYKNNYSILHIDAHHDLREAYLGFTHSHASIFYNVIKSDFAPKSLVQLAIRDFCKEEFDMAKEDSRIHVHYDREIKERMLMQGDTWKKIAEEITGQLNENVYISVDIDGFDPKLCPNTGTPVLGGIEFDHFYQLLKQIKSSGKKIVGFDLVEVSPGDNPDPNNEWDGNVGMRVLFEMCKFASF